MSGNKKILIITYYWPPSGGAGVQRWLKMSKYLPAFGWDPYILTIDSKYAEYPVIDESLIQDIHPELRVFKTKARNYYKLFHHGKRERKVSGGFSKGNNKGAVAKITRFIRGNFFIPDPRKGWNNFAVKQAINLIKKEDIKYIITTSPPHSTQLIGLRLKRIFPGIKWIADLRDPWTDIYYYKMLYPTKIARRIDSRLESRVLLNCDKLITVGEKLAELFITKEPSVSEKMEIIYNGYDESDFKTLPSKKEPDALITYVGTLSDQYPVDGLLDALENFKLKYSSKIILRIVGEVSKKWSDLISEKLGNNFQFITYSNHSRAIDYMAMSNILLIVIPKNTYNRVIVTGKVFEYLRTEVPILCLGPTDGEAAEIIKKFKAGSTYNYHDSAQISGFIQSSIQSPGKYLFPEQLSRYHIAKHLSDSVNS